MTRTDLNSTDNRRTVSWDPVMGQPEEDVRPNGTAKAGVAADGQPGPERLVACVHTDLVKATELQDRLTETGFQSVLERHRRYVRKLTERFGGEIIDNPGDGYFLIFHTSSRALAFALLLQQAHATDGEPDLPKVRIGIDQGEVVVRSGQYKAVEVHGLTVTVAKRLESKAQPSQILLSAKAFNDARRSVTSDELDLPDLAWQLHGCYRLKGLGQAVEIAEVGVPGVAPLKPPEGRWDDPDMINGWRPARDKRVPQLPNWILEKKLGEGGFGEVWQARAEQGHGKRVFKFCFQRERVRSLKQEVRLFEFLTRELGHRDDIATLEEWHFKDAAPYWLAFQYSPGGNLLDWSRDKGSLLDVPLSTRVEIVAKVADALAAAHSVGVVHKDVKPSNILITEDQVGVRIKLLDFGLGWICPDKLRECRESRLSMSGIGSDEPSSGAGSLYYMAPELIDERTIDPTPSTDIYALGVVLYQLVVGNFTATPAQGFASVHDELLREDIQACLQFDPRRRLANAAELAARLRALSRRRAERDAHRRTRVAHEVLLHLRELEAHKRQQFYYRVTFLLLFMGALLGWLGWTNVRNITYEGEEQVISRQYVENAAQAGELADMIHASLGEATTTVEVIAVDEPGRLRDAMRDVWDLAEWRDLKACRARAAEAAARLHNLEARSAQGQDDVFTKALERARSEWQAKSATATAAEDMLVATEQWMRLFHVLVSRSDQVVRETLRKANARGSMPHHLPIYSWALADADGNLLVRTPNDPGVVGKNFDYRDWFHGMGTKDKSYMGRPISSTHVSDPFVSKAYERLGMIGVSTPIRDADGDTIGVLLGTVPLDEYLGRQYTSKAPSGGDRGLPHVYPVIINDRDQVVTHPDNPLFRGNEDPPIPGIYPHVSVLRDASRKGAAGITWQDPFLGEQQVVGICPIDVPTAGKPWLAIIQTSKADLVRPLRDVQRGLQELRSTAFIMLGFGVVLILAAMTAGRVKASMLVRAAHMGASAPGVK